MTRGRPPVVVALVLLLAACGQSPARPPAGGIPFVVAGEQIWGARPGTLWVLDPATKAVSREIPLPGVAEILGMDVDIATNEAWLAVRMTGRDGAVLRLDLLSGPIVGTAPVSLPAAVKIVGPEVYVASYLDNELLVYGR